MSASYAAVAAALRDIADRLEMAAESGALHVSLSIQPDYPRCGDAATIATVDAASVAVLAHRGETMSMGRGAYHHCVDGRVGPVRVSVFGAVDPPGESVLHAEVERLRAQVAELGGTP